MKLSPWVIFVAIASCGFSAHCAGLLKPMTFPKTFDDLSFTQRMDVKRTGYEDWEPTYDESGRCVRGCPYAGMTIEDDLAAMERRTNAAVAQLRASGLLSGSEQNIVAQMGTAQNISQATQHQNIPAPAPGNQAPQQNSTPHQTPSTNGVNAPTAPAAPVCNPYNSSINPNNTVPLGEPVMGRPRISSKFGDRIHPVTGQRIPHYGVDLAVPAGTDVFSPARGTVAAVWTDDSCGRGIRITHADGYQTVYCHLSEQLVKIGDIVHAGCRIAKSGNTGMSTGAHLHYGIKWDGVSDNKGYIDPEKLMGRRG